ncbi:MAG: response regulator [Candidatus Omnitrophica bacterium]|nr:response regulator [Candidatus Omnitrophota bacterium]
MRNRKQKIKKKILGTSDVAKYCDVDRRTVLNWIDEDKIKIHRTPGRHVRIEPDDLVKFLKKYNMPVPQDLVSCGEKKNRILVVDDDKNIANSLKRLLGRNQNYEVETAYDGFEAGGKLVTHKPQLIVLDICMPGMDGFEVAKSIRSSVQSNIKIIAISGYLNKENEEKMIASGADVCMAKPVDADQLQKKIQELLEKEAGGQR